MCAKNLCRRERERENPPTEAGTKPTFLIAKGPWVLFLLGWAGWWSPRTCDTRVSVYIVIRHGDADGFARLKEGQHGRATDWMHLPKSTQNRRMTKSMFTAKASHIVPSTPSGLLVACELCHCEWSVSKSPVTQWSTRPPGLSACGNFRKDYVHAPQATQQCLWIQHLFMGPMSSAYLQWFQAPARTMTTVYNSMCTYD